MRLRFDGLGARARGMGRAARTRPGRSRAATPSPRRSDRRERHGRRFLARHRRVAHPLRRQRLRRDHQGRRRRDAQLPRRRVPAVRGPHRRARQRPHLDQFRALPGGGAESGAGLGCGEKPRRAQGHERRRARIPRRLAPARRRLYRGQDRRARAGRRVARPDGDRIRTGPSSSSARPANKAETRRWASSASIISSGAASTRRCPT